VKVGDLVIMKHPDDWDPEDVYRPIKLYMQEYPGSGVILKVLNSGSYRQTTNCEVYWADTGKTSWHPANYLRVVG
jgi:hypothetical protein